MGKELELAIKIAGKVDKSLGAAVNTAQAQLNSISKFTNKAMTAATVAVAAAGAKIVTDSIETYKDYQSAISSAAATGGIERGTADYEALDKAAREAGRTTVKTAKESANALEYMMLAGWSVQDSTKALMPILKLSAATGADLATTSDLVTDSMASLGLGIGDVNHYLDALAKANNIENYSSQQLLESFIGVGGVLKNLSVPFEKGAAVLGVMASQGLKGSEAGTALNAILVNMQKKGGDSAKAMKNLGISMYDTDGKARDLLAVFQDVHDKTAGMTQEQRNLMYQMIGGKSHYEDFAKIMAGFSTDTESGMARAYELAEAFENSDGALDKLYDIKTDTLEGSMNTLKSAYEGMLIDIGEHTSPVVNEAVKNITNKIPQIEEIIISSLERVLPAAEKAFNFLINNSDKIISGAINMAKAFAMFKIGTGAAKGITGAVSLVKNLSQIGKTAGAAKVLQGIIGTFTGVSTAAGTAGGTLTAFAGTAIATVAPVAAVAAGIVGLAIAFDGMSDYSRGMNKAADAIGNTSKSLIKYNDIANEVKELRAVIHNPASSTAEIDAAQSKLQEIANMLGEEYNLTINADTTQLENAISMAQQASRGEMISQGTNLIGKVQKGAEGYARDTASVKDLEKQQGILQQMDSDYSTLQSDFDLYSRYYRSGLDTQEEYLSNMNKLYNKAKNMGVEFEYIGDTVEDYDVQRLFDTINSGADDARSKLGDVKFDLEEAQKRIADQDKATSKAGKYLSQALASDIQSGNAYGADTDIEMLNKLGEAMVKAGMNTAEVATNFAAAKEGFADFNAAIEAGAAEKMAQNFIDFNKTIGETTENAVQGAALIANGFDNVAAATAKGDDAVLAVINDLQKFGDTQGLLEGLDANGVADKLTDMAHAMQLIPENKSIAIDAEGNLSVIQEAENQIASLNSIGNVDVSVNANGDLSIMDEANNLTGTLQGLGAVSLQVNAEGNIEVLDKAQEVIATVDSKNAQVSINGQVYGLDQLEQAANTAQQVDGKSGTVTLNATDNATPTIQMVQNSADTLNNTKVNPSITANDQASSVISSVSSQLSNLDGKTATTTIITKYETKGTPPAHSATGAYSWRGGLTYVNDQRVADPREVIETNGMRYYYEGKNVLADIPKGARIYTAAESRAIINGSHRNGLERVPFDGYIAELHQGERVLTSEEASEYGDYRLGDYLDMLLELMDDNPRNSGGGDNNSSQRIVFSPNITIYGDADEERVMSAMRMSQREFEERYDEMCRDRRRKAF